ncbi:MAG: SPOR domain-containing protein, partial [Saprospiraceae bacterium]|nr:SPOR domain-containing protein [Saprospiraceae bacterium]
LSAMFVLQSGISFEQTVSRAIQVSHEYQRPLMLLFVSKDCSDCTTIQSYLEGEEIRDAVARSYVAARVDIDDFDGKACSEIYGIGKVPALVIVDSKGTIMYKAQGSISLKELATMIETSSASAMETTSSEHANTVAVPETVQNPAEKKEPVLQQDTDQPVAVAEPSRANAKPVIQRKAETKALNTTPPARTNFSGKSYSLQLGFFSNREYAVRMQQRALQNGLQGVEILPVHRDGQDFFRVLFGDYPTAQAADLSSAPLKESGFEVKVHRNRM